MTIWIGINNNENTKNFKNGVNAKTKWSFRKNNGWPTNKNVFNNVKRINNNIFGFDILLIFGILKNIEHIININKRIILDTKSVLIIRPLPINNK